MLKSGAVIGIMGGGQLGRMLAMAAAHMGFRAHVFTPQSGAPAAQVTDLVTLAEYDDRAALEAFAKSCDVITFEFENIPYESLALLKDHCRVAPDPEVLRICRHRLREKDRIRQAGIGTAPYLPVRSLRELQDAAATLGTPCVLKSCELGYDGKGQFKLDDPAQAQEAWQSLQTEEAILEGWLDYDCEISVIVARGKDGNSVCFEPALNVHHNHILATSTVPSGLSDTTIGQAKAMAIKLADALDLVGIMAAELFVMNDGSLLVNELAPRPHNSGHWTMEAAATSQFEQQIRAIAGIALGDTATLCPAEMTNLIGDDVQRLEAYYADQHAHVHLYGKSEARSGRKMGHVTRLKNTNI